MLLADLELPAVSRRPRLFAGDPRTPWRHAAGAVTHGAREGRPCHFPFAFFRIEPQVCRPATAVAPVCDFRSVDVRRRRHVPFMIPNENQLAGVSQLIDNGHAVVQVRARRAIAQQIARPAVRDVAKPVGQLQQRKARGLVDLRTDGAVRAGNGCGVNAAGHECSQRERPERAGAHGSAAQERAAVCVIRVDHVGSSSR